MSKLKSEIHQIISDSTILKLEFNRYKTAIGRHIEEENKLKKIVNDVLNRTLEDKLINHTNTLTNFVNENQQSSGASVLSKVENVISKKHKECSENNKLLIDRINSCEIRCKEMNNKFNILNEEMDRLYNFVNDKIDNLTNAIRLIRDEI